MNSLIVTSVIDDELAKKMDLTAEILMMDEDEDTGMLNAMKEDRNKD